MAEDSLEEFLKAVVPALRADAAVAAVVGEKVYTHVPQGTAMPYLEVGDSTTQQPFDAKDFNGDDMTFQLDGWSETSSMLQISQLMGAARRLLNRNNLLVVTGHQLVDIRWEFGQVLREPDGITRHGVARYRVTTVPQ